MSIDTDAEIRALRTVLRDLVALSTIPTAWVGMEPAAVAAGLADALIGLLRLDFVFVRLCVPSIAGVVDVTRGRHGRRFRNGWKVISPRAAGSRLWKSFPMSAATSSLVTCCHSCRCQCRGRYGCRGLWSHRLSH